MNWLCNIGKHKWDNKATALNDGWVKTKCNRKGCTWVKLMNLVTREVKQINTIIFFN